MLHEFGKVAVIGTGMMGGSFALALKAERLAEHVSCYDISPQTRQKALELQVADEVCENPVEAAADCDLLVIATPVGSVVSVFREIRDSLKDGVVVTDIGSAKVKLVTEMEKLCTEKIHYIGGHPMTGSEQSGVESARPDLYKDSYYILTPTERTHTDSFRRLHALLTKMGARVLSMDPVSHDRAMATISHVPHLISLLLMDMAADERKSMENLFTIVAGGFRDMTRIAASKPELWIDICMANRDFIIKRLEDYSSRILDLVRILEEEDYESLREKFEKARKSRIEISIKAGREISDLYEVSIPVPDRPGVISGVTTAVGSAGVNIEDISIAHPLLGETGILTLKILGEENAKKAARQIEVLGFIPTVRKS